MIHEPSSTSANTSESSRAYEYTVFDVFAEHALEGNPLAVFHDARGLSDDEMQALARETRLSETTFVLPSEEDGARGSVRVRIFTTEEELPFAGHPTLGTATWLHQHHPELRGRNEITLDLNVGPIPVCFLERPGAGAFASMRQNDPAFGATFGHEEVAEVIGLHAAKLDTRFAPQSVSTGNTFCIVLLRDLATLERLSIPQREAEAWLRERGMRWFYVMAPTDAPLNFRCRMQFNGGEDPATGSAAGPAIAWLVANRLVPAGAECVLDQGVEIRRPSRLYARASQDGNRVHEIDISGRTIPVAMGRYFLP
ncbi:MAG: PhzF family phenazine biosynthesis protein [Acidobacteriaceae bacterium]|nr:PhzF family phenazine biosynthesis protein [Acidobacteriaceae bacterium]